MVQFLFEFEAYFNHVWRDINLKNIYSAWIQQIREAMVAAWDLSSAIEKEADKLENQLQEYLDKKALFDDQISSCRILIAELTKEIEGLEEQKDNIIDQEAH